MDLMGDGATLLSTRQIREQRGSAGDMSTPATVSALLPAPRPGEDAGATDTQGTVQETTRALSAAELPEPAGLAELPDEEGLALREEAEIEARHRRAADQGDPGA